MNKYFIYVILVVVVLAGFYFYYAGTQKGQEMPVVGSTPSMPLPEMSGNAMMPVMPGAPEMVAIESKNHIVEIIDNEFRPVVLQVKKGDSVTWINKMTNPSWPASAMHPTHAVYPETGGCIASAFDVCRGLKTGESWTFTFNQIGQWKYHDHINFSVVKPGTIEVSE